MPYPSPTHFLMASLVIQVGLDCSSMSGSICHTIFSTEAATCGHMCSVKGGGGKGTKGFNQGLIEPQDARRRCSLRHILGCVCGCAHTTWQCLPHALPDRPLQASSCCTS